MLKEKDLDVVLIAHPGPLARPADDRGGERPAPTSGCRRGLRSHQLLSPAWNAPMPLRGGKGRARRRISWLADPHLHPEPSHEESLRSGCRPIRLGMQLPAYSGGTAWDLHPLRATAGQNRWMRVTGSSVSCPVSISQSPAHLRREPGALAPLALWHPWQPWHLGTSWPAPGTLAPSLAPSGTLPLTLAPCTLGTSLAVR